VEGLGSGREAEGGSARIYHSEIGEHEASGAVVRGGVIEARENPVRQFAEHHVSDGGDADHEEEGEADLGFLFHGVFDWNTATIPQPC